MDPASSEAWGAFAASEEHLRVFVENAPAGLAMFDRDMRYIAASARYAEVYRLHVKSLVGRLHTDVFPDIPERWKEVWRRCLDGAVERAKDDPFPRTDGSLDYVDWEVRPWRNALGQIGGVILLSEVVTDRRLAAEALVRSEERFRALFDRAPVGMAELAGPDAKIVRANGQLADILEVDTFTLRGRPLADLVLPSDRDHLLADLAALRSRRATRLERELQIARPRGRTANVSVTYVTLEFTDAIMVTVEDVSRRQAVEASAEAAERRWAAVMKAAADGIVVVKLEDGTLLDANEGFERLSGWSRQEILGRSSVDLGMFVDPSQREGLKAAMREHGRADWTGIRLRRKDAEEREVAGHSAALVVDGEPALVTILEDMTAAKDEAAAVAARDRWAALIRSSPFALTITSASTGRLIDVNPSFEQLTGYSRAELIGHSTTELGIVVDAERRQQLAEDAAMRGRSSADGVRIRTKAGAERVVNIAFSIDRLGGEVCFVGIGNDVTDQLREVEAIEARERAILAIFDNAPIGLAFTVPGEGRISAANPRFCQMLGYTREDLLAKSILEITHPDDRAITAETMARMASGAVGEVSVTKRFLRKDGDILECDLRIASIPREPGEPLKVVIGFTDLTERQRAERSIREAEQRWSAIFEATREAIIITSAEDDRIIDVNAAGERLTGFSREEMRKRTAVELGLVTRLSAPEEQRKDHREVPLRRKDGPLRRCDVSTTTLTLDGRAARVSVVTDITDRRAAEEALVASEDRYRDLVEHLEAPIVSTDLGGIVTYANPAVACFGYAPTDLIGRPSDRLLPADDQALGAAWRDALRRGPTPAPRDGVILDRTGKRRPVRFAARAISRDGVLTGLTGIFTDLTTQRAVEEQLRASQRMEAVGRLAGGVAHDFNNLLTVILSYAEIARSEIADGSPTQECLEEVIQAGQRAEGLTRQLLAFSRKQLIVLEPVSIDRVVGGVSSMLRRLIGEDIALEVSLAPDLPQIKAEVAQLELVLMNLVINARDAMPDGGTIEVGARRTALEARAAAAAELPPGDYVELAVRDTGSGMDDETRARIFEPFFTTKAVGKGTGLGLSTVYGIVKQFGGGITVESTLGVGTTFRIYLPVLAAVPAEAEAPLALATRPPVHGTESLLVVEDDAAMRRVIRRVLTNAGYRVVMCSTPGEALEACQSPEADFDLVLTDVVMPEMNGRELSRRVHEVKPEVPVVYMSGYTDEALERLDVLHGNFLRKPFGTEALRDVVRAALDRSATPRSKAPAITTSP